MNAQFDRWNEIRTAFLVARHGTLSAAASELGIHHTTAQRQVTALEKRLRTRLFYRNPRGYVPTDAGLSLLQVAEATQDQFDQLAARISGFDSQLSGKLIVTTIPEIGPLLVPLLAEYQQHNPGLSIELIADQRLLKLEYGEAHVSIRAGPAPTEPDNVAQRLIQASASLYASRDYVARYGQLISLDGLEGHRFVARSDVNGDIALVKWMNDRIPKDAISFRASDSVSVMAAIEAGMGIGMAIRIAALASGNLVEMIPPLPDWHAQLWLVTHVDLHRSAKVQSFLAFIKSAFEARQDAIMAAAHR
ncbi:MAG: LysR family transcriptional regulator [Alphaproteobacteria bacterium]|nr:LysR family transcriptional regulator [Alphaproteobacteria bacterium]